MECLTFQWRKVSLLPTWNLAFKSTGSIDGEIHLMSKIINFEKEIRRVVDQPEKVSGMCCHLLISTRPPFLQDTYSVF